MMILWLLGMAIGDSPISALNSKYLVFPKCCTVYNSHSASSCVQEFNSSGSKNGTFSSPNYPDPYPSNVNCIYKFVGKPHERVQISFTDFELYMPEDASKDCEAVDAVMIFITINGRLERLDNFCGTVLPPQLMSNGPVMEVRFQSFSTEGVKGFQAIYRFVTDFGIPSAKQENSECRFLFQSEEKGNGTFSSPNYPGFYPRDTECHYIFRGKDKERVHITFAYFDIDGIPPCLSETASDYVEFSNYKTVDRKLARHCGNQKAKLVESDADFFRVIFKSNDKFDGTGFEAFYQFRKQVDPFMVKRISALPKDGKSRSIVLQINPLFVILCFFVCIIAKEKLLKRTFS